jgi:hypothetical protein
VVFPSGGIDMMVMADTVRQRGLILPPCRNEANHAEITVMRATSSSVGASYRNAWGLK